MHQALFALASMTAACLCWWPRAVTRRSRRAWRVLAIGMLLAAFGNISGLVHPALSDVFHLASYPLVIVAVVLLVRDRGPRAIPAVWLDGLVVGLGVGAVAAAVVAPLLRPPPAMSAEVITNLAYPVADLTLLVVLGTIGGVTRLPVDRRLAVLGLGLGIDLIADLAHLDPLRPLALVAVAAAACIPDPPGLPDRRPVATSFGHGAVAVPTLAGLGAWTVLMVEDGLAIPPATRALAGACVLVALLRAALALHQLRALPEARREARTDPLTGLANRRLLHEHCARLLARLDAAPLTLLMIDLDGFKTVNDRHGHDVGDALLVEVAARLAAVMRRDDLLTRLGGDEFAAVLPATCPPEADLVAHRMHAALAAPIVIAGREFTVEASIGISSSTGTDWTPASMLHDADSAMYRAKSARAATAAALPTRSSPGLRRSQT